jgi:phytoene dehydrogenase-like protein
MPDYDVIVIGAGHNGLATATLLRRAGLSVLCLEKNRYVGGMCSTVELFDGYKFEIAGSTMFPLADQVVEDLQLHAHGFEPIEHEVMSCNIGDPGDPPVILYSDPMRAAQHMIEVHGAEAAEGLMRLFEYVKAPADAMDRFTPLAKPKRLSDVIANAATAAEREAIKTTFFGSAMDVIGKFFPDPGKHRVIRAFLAFLAVQSAYKGPYTAGSAACLAYSLASPPGGQLMHKLKGGLGAVSIGLGEYFEELGGELRLHTSVERILNEGGRAVGVELQGGERITARSVVSNLDPTSTFLRLMDAADLPSDFVDAIEAIDHRGAYVQIQVALSELPEFTEEWAFLNEGEMRGQMGIFNSAELLEHNWDQCRRGQVPDDVCVGFQIPSVLDPDLAPEGHHAATLYAYYFPVTAPRSEHGRLKDLMAERVIEKVTRYAPNFRESILHQATFAPYHYESMFGCTNGDFTHGLIHPDQLLEFRPVLGSEGGYRTPIAGLYMCGSSCYPGPGVTFLPGYNSAHIVLEDMG